MNMGIIPAIAAVIGRYLILFVSGLKVRRSVLRFTAYLRYFEKRICKLKGWAGKGFF
jgi:hypothetical protein